MNTHAFRLSVVLGALIQTERNARRLTQQQIASVAGVHPMTVSKVERGIQQDVGVETLQRIASALSSVGKTVTASELLGSAERWQERLEVEKEAGRLPVEDVETGAALAAIVALVCGARS